MPTIRSWAGAFASALLITATASAQYVPATGRYHSPVTHRPVGIAPDACGPGFYVWCPDGQTIGPNYWLRPGFEPYNGVRPQVYRINNGRPEFAPSFQQLQPSAPAAYPYHPYARGPRDFFMFRENLEDELNRQGRPQLLP